MTLLFKKKKKKLSFHQLVCFLWLNWKLYGWWWYVKADLGVKARVPDRQKREKHSF